MNFNSKTNKYSVGTKHINKDCLEFEIIEYIDYNTRNILFIKSGYIKTVHTTSIKSGSILDDLDTKYSVGKEFFTNEGYTIKIVERINSKKVKIMFLDSHNGIIEVNPISVNSGRIKNPYHKSVCGVGYTGIGIYKNSTHRKISTVWRSIILRCTSITNGKYPTYKNVTVCEEWHNFQNFARWYEDNYPSIENIRFELDKDLLQQDKEYKVYSPNTCVFLPHNVNSFLANKKSNNTSGVIGVYWHKLFKKWVSSIRSFNDNETIREYFDDKYLAENSYTYARKIKSEKVKDYLLELDYLNNDIIQLIK